MQIRQENIQDYFEVLKLTRETFWSEKRMKEHGLGALEHYMVHEARRSIMVKALSLVAEDKGKVVGHVMCSTGSYILDSAGAKHLVLTLGPLTVRKNRQNQGIGSRLMDEVIKRAKSLNYKAILLFGHPSYYPRFGFKEASTYDLMTEKGEQFPAFMALELEEGWLGNVTGKYIVHPLFDEETIKHQAMIFDKEYFSTN